MKQLTLKISFIKSLPHCNSVTWLGIQQKGKSFWHMLQSHGDVNLLKQDISVVYWQWCNQEEWSDFSTIGIPWVYIPSSRMMKWRRVKLMCLWLTWSSCPNQPKSSCGSSVVQEEVRLWTKRWVVESMVCQVISWVLVWFNATSTGRWHQYILV